MEPPFEDKVLKCKDCSKEFIWSAHEQEFFYNKGFKNKPARCKDCRKQNREKVESEYFRVICSNCNLAGDVLFKPKNPSAKIYCKDCFSAKYLPKPRRELSSF